MGLVELLVHGRIVGEGTVIDTVDPIVAAQARRDIEGIGPAAVQHAGGIGPHQAEPVQRTVGQDTSPPALADIGGIAEDVGHAVVAAETEVGNLGSVHGLLGAHGLVEAAPQREWRITGDGIIHLNASQVHVLGLGVVSAGIEPDCTEIVAGNVVEHIVGTEQDGRIVIVPAAFHVEGGEKVVIHLLDPQHGGQGDVEHVLDKTIVHRYLGPVSQETRRLDDQGVQAVFQILDQELSILGGRHRGHLGSSLQEGQPRVFHRLLPIAVHDGTLHPTGRSLRREGQAGQEGQGC